MSVQVIHFGCDDCDRMEVLRSVGYEVTESASLEGRIFDLQSCERVDAVVVSEDGPHSAEQAADLVRQHCTAPLILFRSSEARLDESKFDKIYSSVEMPRVWLNDVAALIERGRDLCPCSHDLIALR